MSVGNGAIPPDFAADATSLEMSLQRVDIQPGETFGYAISPKTILMANAKGGLLERQAWAEGEPVGKPVKIIANEPYLLHNYGSGYFTLTNISANPVSIVLFSVAPPGSEYSANPAGTAVVDTPFGTWIPDPTPIPNSSEIQHGRHE